MEEKKGEVGMNESGSGGPCGFQEGLALSGGAEQATEVPESDGKGRGTPLLASGCTTRRLIISMLQGDCYI